MVGAKSINFTNKQLMTLIWPLVIEQFLNLTIGLADSMMVAQVGDAAVSGVSLVDSVSILMVFIFSAMAAGGAAVCGQYIGRSNYRDAKSAGQHLILLLAVVSVAVTALMYALKYPVIHLLFGQIDPDVMAATDKYYTIVMAAIPGIAIYNGGAALFRIMERTDITLKTSILSNLINVAGNAILIFGFGCGVEGVAIPTVVSRWVGAAVMLFLLANKKYPLNLSDIRQFKYNKTILKNCVSLGIPNGVENGMFQLGKIALYSYIATLGTANIAANAVGLVMANLHVMPGIAINLAMTTVISQCVGAGAYDKAKYYLHKLLKWSYAAVAVWVGILTALLPLILKIYDLSPEATALAWKIVLLHAVVAAALWIPAFMVPNFIRSAGDAAFTMIVSCASMWIGRVGCGLVLAKYLGLGLMGVWLAHTLIDWSARFAVFAVRYKNGKWMTKAIRQ